MGINMPRIVRFEGRYAGATAKFVLDILEGEFGITGVERPDLSKISDVYQKGKSDFWIALEGNDVVGTIALADYGNGRGYLKRMYIGRQFRGTGLASALLETLLEFAKKNGYKEIYAGTVEKMVAANKFYQKHGFGRITAVPEDLPECGDTLFYVRKLWGGAGQ
jgi:GNAT superfamily N-acetyltransferase